MAAAYVADYTSKKHDGTKACGGFSGAAPPHTSGGGEAATPSTGVRFRPESFAVLTTAAKSNALGIRNYVALPVRPALPARLDGAGRTVEVASRVCRLRIMSHLGCEPFWVVSPSG